MCTLRHPNKVSGATGCVQCLCIFVHLHIFPFFSLPDGRNIILKDLLELRAGPCVLVVMFCLAFLTEYGFSMGFDARIANFTKKYSNNFAMLKGIVNEKINYPITSQNIT